MRKKMKHKIDNPALIEELIKLAWADTVPFETIAMEFGLSENEVVHFMRTHQTANTYRRWRERVRSRRGASSKHAQRTRKTSAHMRD